MRLRMGATWWRPREGSQLLHAVYPAPPPKYPLARCDGGGVAVRVGAAGSSAAPNIQASKPGRRTPAGSAAEHALQASVTARQLFLYLAASAPVCTSLKK